MASLRTTKAESIAIWICALLVLLPADALAACCCASDSGYCCGVVCYATLTQTTRCSSPICGGCWNCEIQFACKEIYDGLVPQRMCLFAVQQPEDFEERSYRLPRAPPEVLHFLMQQHALKQKDLADVFGTPSIVSEVLHGHREMNKEHIKRLCKRFQVSPELFF